MTWLWRRVGVHQLRPAPRQDEGANSVQKVFHFHIYSWAVSMLSQMGEGISSLSRGCPKSRVVLHCPFHQCEPQEIFGFSSVWLRVSALRFYFLFDLPKRVHVAISVLAASELQASKPVVDGLSLPTLLMKSRTPSRLFLTFSIQTFRDIRWSPEATRAEQQEATAKERLVTVLHELQRRSTPSAVFVPNLQLQWQIGSN